MLAAWTSLLIRSGLIMGAANLLCRFSREKLGPAYRYRIIASGFLLLLLWPTFSAFLPEISLPVWQHPNDGIVTVTQTLRALNQPVSTSSHTNWPLLIWALGAFLSLLPIFTGYIRMWRVIAAAAPITDENWRDLLVRECERLRLRKQPELLQSKRKIVPLTFGITGPRILLPAGCFEWDASQRRMVLLHELMHIRRRDLAWQIFANVVTALWWFQPLCWLNGRTLRQESEKACDEWVLHSGIRASEYASQLLVFAQQFGARAFGASRAAFPLTTAIVRRGDLEERVRAILNSKLPPKACAFPVIKVLLLITLTLSASAVTIFSEQNKFQGGYVMKRTVISGLLASAGLTAATIGGSVFDPNGAAISNAHASLYNPDTGVQQELTTTPDGKFTFPSLPAGSYILHIQKPGFASLYREFTIKPDSDVQRGLVLESASAASTSNAAAAQETTPQAIRVGGEFAQAKLIHKVQPVYPASAKAAGIQGTVRLDVTISKDGIPEDIRVISSPSDDLTQSALEAVRQWQYSSTLLNGEPVAVMAEVIVNYTLAK